MPYASDPAFGDHKLSRTLIYGLDKVKKTWWLCRAAEFGYKVVLLDGDDGAHIVKQIAPEFRKNILVVDLVNTTTTPVYAQFIAMLSRAGNKFLWDEQEKRSYVGQPKAGHSYIRVNPALLHRNTILGIDSWTALCASSLFQYANEQHIDLADAAKEEWDGYGFQGRFLDHVLNVLHALPCHVVVVGHEYVYEKYKGKGKDRTLISATTLPISCSGPHSQKLGKHFSDVLQFKRLSETAFRISSEGDANRAGGSRQIPPGVYDWDKLTIGEMLKYGGHPVPNTAIDYDMPDQISGFEWIAPLSEAEVAALPPPGTMPRLITPTVETAKAPVLEANKTQGSILLRKT